MGSNTSTSISLENYNHAANNIRMLLPILTSPPHHDNCCTPITVEIKYTAIITISVYPYIHVSIIIRCILQYLLNIKILLLKIQRKDKTTKNEI
jgi:hypothetical protein